MIPLLSAPAALKYLNITLGNPYARPKSFKACSTYSLLHPYGLIGCCLVDSSIGIFFGIP